MTSNKDFEKLLSDPFESEDVEWRVQQSGVHSKGGWAMVIPYITSRAVQQRFDDVFGVFGWKNEFRETADGKGYLCGISIECGEKWITKWDGAEFTGIEALKGALSGATKRSAVQFGVGRYLYNLEPAFVVCNLCDYRKNVTPGNFFIKIKDKGGVSQGYEWGAPTLPEWALPSVKIESLCENMKIAKNYEEMKGEYVKAYRYASSFNRGNIMREVVELYNELKDGFSEGAEEEMSKDYNKLFQWVESRISDRIFTASNISVLKQSKKSISESLIASAGRAGIDPVDLLKSLETSYQNQLSKINNGATKL